MDEFVQKCYKVACDGEKDRGSDGVVYSSEDMIGYLFLHELQLPQEFKDNVQDLLDDIGGEYFVVIQKQNCNLHVSKIVK